MISSDLPSVSIERLLKRYGSGKRRARLEPIYQAALNEAEHFSEPAALHAEFQLLELPELSEWLTAETTFIVLALCTLGPHIQHRIEEISQKDLISAVILDEITLAWVTAITRQIHRSIRSQARERRLKAGPAYRPGLGRWPLEAQHTIFTHLPAETIGVTLNDHLLMTPRQSTSLIIPLFNRNQSSRQ